MNIIERARKLHALQKRAATPGEANAAARALAKLIARHRLDSAALDEPEEFAKPDEPLFAGQRIPPWKEDLADTLCRHYGVFLIVRYSPSRDSLKKYIMCGTPDDVGCVRFMYALLSIDAERLARRATLGLGRRATRSWRLGFVHGIDAQLVAARREAAEQRAQERAEPSSKALMRLDGRLARAQEHYESTAGKIPVKKTHAPRCDQAAYIGGLRRGSTHHLGKSLTEGETP